MYVNFFCVVVLFIYMMILTQKKMIISIFSIILLFSFFTSSLFCQTQTESQEQENLEEVDFSTLFQNYKANNRDYQKLEIQLQQSIISYQESCVQNGIDFSVSSGRTGIEFAENATNINLSPEVSISSAKLNNSSLSVNLPFSFDVTDEGISSSKINGASVMLSTDIISDVSEQKKLSLEKANRNVLESKRNLEKGKTKIYSSFLQELRELYSSALAVTQAENSLIEKQLDFDTTKAKGYATSSAKYRTAFLEVESAKRSVREKERLYKSSLAIFAAKCSVKSSQIDLNFELPQVKLNSIRDYKKDDFSELEKANWNYQINSQSRNINSDFSLSVQAGYGFSLNDESFSDSAQAGLTINYKGIALSATTAIPINQNSNPSLSFSLGWKPSTSKIQKLSVQNENLQDKLEQLEIANAQESFFDTVLQMSEKRSNLEWETEQNLEQEKLYAELEKDVESWYKKGIVSESEYRQAKVNYENAKVKLALTKIDRIIYNNDLSMLFVTDSTEEKAEGENEN